MWEPHERTALPLGESMRLLGSVALGRVVFTARALPAIQPVNHVVVGGVIVFRGGEGTAIMSAVHAVPGDTVVAFEADDIDPETWTGWSVIVVGRATVITDSMDAAQARELFKPSADGRLDPLIRIQPSEVNGSLLAVPLAPLGGVHG